MRLNPFAMFAAAMAAMRPDPHASPPSGIVSEERRPPTLQDTPRRWLRAFGGGSHGTGYTPRTQRRSRKLRRLAAELRAVGLERGFGAKQSSRARAHQMLNDLRTRGFR